MGMWDEGIERNVRSFEAAVARQDDPDDEYGHQAYHSLTWIPYGYQQQGKNKQAREYIAKIQKQMKLHNSAENAKHRNNLAKTRASYVVDTQEWDSDLANLKISHKGLSDYAHVTDIYAQGLIAIKRGDLDLAREELAKMEGDMMGGMMGGKDSMDKMGSMAGMVMTSGKRSEVAPSLLRLALQGQMALAEGKHEKALELIQKAEKIEGALPSEYGPPVPVQPMAELLADVYAEIGDKDMARKYYEISLERAVGRVRSLNGLSKLSDK